MGYFSRLAMDFSDRNNDDGYPFPEKQLIWRLDDLKARLEDLLQKGAAYRDGYLYTENDIRLALPEQLSDICKVERAIESARSELLLVYGINAYEAEEIASETICEYGYEQIMPPAIVVCSGLTQKTMAA